MTAVPIVSALKLPKFWVERPGVVKRPVRQDHLEESALPALAGALIEEMYAALNGVRCLIEDARHGNMPAQQARDGLVERVESVLRRVEQAL